MATQNQKEVSERRRHKRFPCDGIAEVTAIDLNVLFRGRLRDISESGCFVETRAHVNLPDSAHVEIRFTAHSSRFTVLALAKSVQPGIGAGFEFIPADPRLGKDFHTMIEGMHAGEA